MASEKKYKKSKIHLIDYSEKRYKEDEIKNLKEHASIKKKTCVSWIRVDGTHDAATLLHVGKHFKLHPLVLEDIANTNQRPKVDDFGDYIYVVLKALFYDDKDGKIKTEEVSIIFGEAFVVSFQEYSSDLFRGVYERLQNEKDRIRNMGSDYLAYALIDVTVDSYFHVLERFGEKIEKLEHRLISNPSEHTLERIHENKRNILTVRRAVWPIREVISNLERNGPPRIKVSTRWYLRDVYDHTVQIIDTIEAFRDMTSSMVDIYLSSNSNKMNEVMKVLTIIATIFIPLTFITGIYGMNFKYMPELTQPWGYPGALLIMALVGVAMLFYFKVKKWL